MIRTTSLINLLTGLNVTPETKTETMRKGQGFKEVNENTIRVDLRHLDDLFMLDGSAHNVLIVDPENAAFFGEKVTVYALAESVGCGNIRWMYPVTDKEGNIIEEMALWTCERSETVMDGVMSFLTDKAPAEGHAEKPVEVHAKRPVEVETPAKPATLEELIRAPRSAANNKAPADTPAQAHANRPVGRKAVIHSPE
ncbi:MAG: hypothetical protein MJ155_01130 [Candidatus Saccharibacteria bacterium]|nr:hypothetical protein [Candidatus Saccharibacteria bacterium]